MWTCKSCGKSGNADTDSTCEACGASRYATLMLIGAFGQEIVRIRTSYGKNNLEPLVGSDSQYADRKQFELFRKGSDWYIRAFPGTRNRTLCNGSEVTETPLLIETGSRISLAGQNGDAECRAEIDIDIL